MCATPWAHTTLHLHCVYVCVHSMCESALSLLIIRNDNFSLCSTWVFNVLHTSHMIEHCCNDDQPKWQFTLYCVFALAFSLPLSGNASRYGHVIIVYEFAKVNEAIGVLFSFFLSVSFSLFLSIVNCYNHYKWIIEIISNKCDPTNVITNLF